MPKKRAVKRGILGHPRPSKQNRVLFFVNSKLNESSDSSSGDDSNDSDFELSDQENKKKSEKKPKGTTRTHTASTTKPKEITESSSSCGSSNWSDGLSYEVLWQIFQLYASNLNGKLSDLETKLGQVCSVWHSVSQDFTLWHHLNVSAYFDHKFSSVTSLSSNSKSKMKLENEFARKLTSLVKRRDNFGRNPFHNLSRLDLSNQTFLTCDLLHQVLANCDSNKLVDLSLAHCKNMHKSSQSSKKEKTNLEWSGPSSALKFEQVIGKHAPNLKRLNLAGLKNNQISSLDDLTFMFAKLGSSSLSCVNLSGSDMSLNHMNTLFENCGANLTALDISNSSIKGPLNWNSISSKCPRLADLNMLGCLSLQTTGPHMIESVLIGESKTTFGHLRKLSLSFDKMAGSSKPTMMCLVKLCWGACELRSLDIRSYQSLLDSRINVFNLIEAPRLERLFLEEAQLKEFDALYLAEAVSARWVDTLLELDLSKSSLSASVISLVLCCFAEAGSQAKLQKLNLAGTSVETSSIKELIRNVKTLQHLDLSSCRSVERGMKRALTKADFKAILK